MTRARTGPAARALIATALLLIASQAAAEAPPAHGYRIFISVDMEGVEGAVSSKQISNDGADYQLSRKVMTGELLAAIAGARKAGATEFTVTDGHGDGQNILIDDLPPGVKLVRGSPLPLQMMEGIQEGKYDGAIFIGYHASASSVRGVRAHTYSSARLSEVRVDGTPASEGYFNAAVAGELGVPVIMVSGDDAATEELAPQLKGAEMVVVKRQVGYHAAEVLAPAVARQMIEDGAARAVGRLGSVAPLKVSKPVTVDVTFHFYRPAEVLAWLPTVQRTGARSVRYQAKDAVAAMRFMAFILSYNDSLEP